MNTWHIKPGPVHMLVGLPIHTSGLSTRDIARITEQGRKAIGELYYSRSLVPDLRGEQPVMNEPAK
jgi:hypothetical protein